MVSEQCVKIHLWERGILAIDLFATKDRGHLFCSQADLSPGSLTDALHLNCGSVLMYAFPPHPPETSQIPVIPKVILRLKFETDSQCTSLAEAMLVLSLLICLPICLPLYPDLLTHHHSQILLPALNSLHLMAWMWHG